jgi:citrate lyase subunit alpha/citrate CoA-transferase
MSSGRKVIAMNMDADSRKMFFFTGGSKDIPSVRKRREKGKIVASLEEAFRLAEVRDGMTVSFHHHLRDGDLVVNMALDVLADMGIRDLVLAPSALFPVHESLLRHVRSGVIRSIEGSVNGPVGRAASEGLFSSPVILRSHGGRVRAMQTGELRVDVAVLAAPAADAMGNLSGISGPSACGSLGYAFTDARYADRVIAVTDNIVPYPSVPFSIPQTHVDWVVPVESIGVPEKIVSGTLRVTRDPLRLIIAEQVAKVVEESGLFTDGFSMQAGAGGISLAASACIRERMKAAGIRGSFISGGITGQSVDMLREGLFESLLDVQSFDLEAVASLASNRGHAEMSASFYANTASKGCTVDMLDAVVLGATQVDTDFNVNVNTESDGVLLHGIGGHMDTAAGAAVTVIVTPLFRGRMPMVVDRVLTVTTPGETVDVVVTERGVAVNPRRKDLLENLRGKGIPLMEIGDLKKMAEEFTGIPKTPSFGEKIIGIVEYRDGTVIDTIRQRI